MLSRSVTSDSLYPLDCRPWGSSVHGISQARMLEWAVIPFSRGSSPPGDQTVSCLSCIGRWIFCHCNTWLQCSSVAQSCPTLCDPMDCSPPGSSVHGISQARMLEWDAIASSRGSFQPRGGTCVSCISCIGRRILYHYGTRGTHVGKGTLLKIL